MKALHVFNLIGILLLTGLCGLQWKIDQDLNTKITSLESTRKAQEQQITEQTGMLDTLRKEFSALGEKFTEISAKAEKTEGELIDANRNAKLLTVERDQAKDAIVEWQDAVKQRDERIKEANNRITKLATDLNSQVAKFNDLATNYNDTVVKFNELVTNRNDLITKYNTLVEEVNKSREKPSKN
jgi:chromosome segregation ATPase